MKKSEVIAKINAELRKSKKLKHNAKFRCEINYQKFYLIFCGCSVDKSC